MDNLQIGTFGWQMPEGQGDFYPDDMPEEWQLDYYSNLFRVVLVAESQWLNWEDDDLEACVEGVEGEFGFYLGIDGLITTAKEAQINAIKQRFGDLLQGVVLFSEEMQVAAVSSIDLNSVPLTLISKKVALPGWHFQINGLQISGNPLGYCDDLPADGKQQAALLKNFMLAIPENTEGAAFFIGGDSINMKHVTNLKVVGEFLGY